MKTFEFDQSGTHYILPIRFGQSTRRELGDRAQASILHAASRIFPLSNLQTILPIEWISTNFRMASSAVKQLLEASLADLGSNENVILDLGGPNQFDPIDPEIFFGIADFCESKLASGLGAIIVVCPGSLLEGAPEAAALDQIKRSGKGFVIFTGDATSGNITTDKSTAHIVGEDVKKDFVESYLEQTANVQKKYEATIVRVPGLFTGQTVGEKFAFTYDFSRGGEYALQLCQKKIEHCAANDISVIFYLSDREWFSTIINDASKLADSRIEFVPIQRHDQVSLHDVSDKKYAVFCSVVRSGGQFVSILGGIASPPEFAWCLGTIDEGNSKYVDENVRKLVLRLQGDAVMQIDLHYEAAVVTNTSLVQDMWKALPIDIDVLRYPHKKYKLSAAEIWAMMIEAGFVPEEYGPDREFLPAVPNFRNMTKWNLAFFTLAIRSQLRACISRNLSENDLILCVNEDAARRISKHIVGTSNERSIAVSRCLLNDLTDVKRGKFTLSGVLAQHLDEIDRLVEQVKYAREVSGLKGDRRMQAIVVDELIVSGATFECLDLLSDEIGLDIVLGVALLKVTDRELRVRYPIRPLYTIPTPSHEIQVA
ncbi:MAG: hypothetical protein ABJJ53_02605 [Sulfitobacter sp.]